MTETQPPTSLVQLFKDYAEDREMLKSIERRVDDTKLGGKELKELFQSYYKTLEAAIVAFNRMMSHVMAEHGAQMALAPAMSVDPSELRTRFFVNTGVGEVAIKPVKPGHSAAAMAIAKEQKRVQAKEGSDTEEEEEDDDDEDDSDDGDDDD
jgi:ribosomal protein L12E/L44/L45/RPP1/RPP2